MQEKKIKSFIKSLFFVFLLLPSIVFGQEVYLQAYPVSSNEVWSNGVILKASTGATSSSNTYRWFEFNLTDNPTTLNSTPRRSLDGKSLYSEKITGLSSNTMYTFRAVVEVNNQKYYGDILHFKTKTSGYFEPTSVADLNGYVYTSVGSYLNGQVYSPTGSGSVSQSTGSVSPVTSVSYSYMSSVVSRQADMVTETSGRFNSNAYPSSDYAVYGWYEWGTTPDLGNRTPRVYVGKGQNLYFAQVLSGLAPGTAYFFRPVIESINGTRIEGTTLVMVTKGIAPYQSVIVPTGNVTPTSTVTPTNNTISKKTPATTETLIPKKTVTIKDPSDGKTVAPGEMMNKTISLENTTGKELVKVSARVILPEGITFLGEKESDCKPFGQVLFCTIGDMAVGQKTDISYKIEVSKELKDKASLETIIIVTGEYKTGEKIENLQRVEMTVDVEKNKEKETTGGFFSGVKDWILILLLILLAITSYFSWKYFMTKKENEEPGDSEIAAYLKEKEPTVIISRPHIAPVNEKGAPPTNLPV